MEIKFVPHTEQIPSQIMCSEGKCVEYKYLTGFGVFNYMAGGTCIAIGG
jgi:hypothetical protein